MDNCIKNAVKSKIVHKSKHGYIEMKTISKAKTK